jgi:hypothetical protein
MGARVVPAATSAIGRRGRNVNRQSVAPEIRNSFPGILGNPWPHRWEWTKFIVLPGQFSFLHPSFIPSTPLYVHTMHQVANLQEFKALIAGDKVVVVDFTATVRAAFRSSCFFISSIITDSLSFSLLILTPNHSQSL